MSTLDICELNLYTGACEFTKIGAACTYIKREHLVDRLSARNLPLGVFQQIEPETIYRQLQDGDYIIMLSDGVLDALEQGIGEEILPELIELADKLWHHPEYSFHEYQACKWMSELLGSYGFTVETGVGGIETILPP